MLRAEALSRIGKLGEARATLQRALEFNPETFAAHSGMGWVLLRAGDYRRATEFFDEALRLNARSQPAQTGALECAKHRYRVYRWLVYLQQWLDGLHLLLRVPVVIALAAGILAALTGLFYLFNQFFRPLLGTKAAGLLAVSLFSGLIGLVIFHGQIFNWLVRHNRAAKLEANEKRRRLSNRSLMTFCAGIFGGIGFSVLQYWLPNLQVVLAGLIPGGFALVIAWTQLPSGKTRDRLAGLCRRGFSRRPGRGGFIPRLFPAMLIPGHPGLPGGAVPALVRQGRALQKAGTGAQTQGIRSHRRRTAGKMSAMNPFGQIFWRGRMLYEQNRYALAESEFRQALVLHPDSAETHAMVALCLHYQGRFPQSEE